MRIRDRRFHQLGGDELYRILKLRGDVFVVEQDCAYPDLDGRDREPGTRHIWIDERGETIAYLRLLSEPDGSLRIGRVVTAPDHRGRGLAERLVRHVLGRSAGPWILDAQIRLVGWYEALGFQVCGDEFDEDGIAHRPMRRPATPRGAPIAMARVKLVVSYDGTPFRGFADNPGVRTVAGDLGDAIERVVGHPVTLTCAGRTDAGVHARGQVVSLDLDPERFAVETLVPSVNALCGPEIVVGCAAVVPDDFDARFSARARTYRYHVLLGSTADPLQRHTAWLLTDDLDLDSMNRAAADIVGTHDFSSFCRASTGRSTVRRVHRAAWTAQDDLAIFEIEADAFCQQMVRSIVGTLVAVGRGRRGADTIPAVLGARDRAAAAAVAPPHGLVLWSVRYDESG